MVGALYICVLTTSFSCDTEYVDIYSELEAPSDDLLSASLGGRYCGTVAPHVRIRLEANGAYSLIYIPSVNLVLTT